MNYFGQNLKTLRLEKRLSQTELGEKLYKGQKTIGNWETGYSEPCIDDLLNISDLFDIDVDALLKNEFAKNNPRAKAKRNRHKEEQAETLNLSVAETKRALQQDIQKQSTAANEEITWRDRYITFLESHLSETNIHPAPDEMMQNLLNQLSSIQKTLSELKV